MSTDWTPVAQASYDAYAAVTDNKNFRGEPMPAFEDLPPKIQDAWRAAASFAFQGGYQDGHYDAMSGYPAAYERPVFPALNLTITKVLTPRSAEAQPGE